MATNKIPPAFDDLMKRKKALAHLATVMPDGSPQVTPVWFDVSDDKVRTSSSAGASPTSPSRAPTSTSTRSPRNTSARTSTRAVSPAKYA